MHNVNRAVGELVSLRESLNPVAGTGSAQNGDWIDRTGYGAAMVPFAYTTSGGVTGGTITVKVQDADNSNGDNPADFGDAVTIDIGAGPNETGVRELAVDLRGARSHIRVVVDSDPTGGTPASIVSAPVLLMAADNLPAT